MSGSEHDSSHDSTKDLNSAHLATGETAGHDAAGAHSDGGGQGEGQKKGNAEALKIPLAVRIRALVFGLFATLKRLAAKVADSASGSEELQSARTDVKNLLLGWLSRDRRTRNGTVVFWLSCFILVFVSASAWKSYSQYRYFQKHGMNEAQVAVQLRNELEAEKIKEAKLHTILVPLGAFTLELAAPKANQGLPRGMMNVAEIEITLECETHDACETIQARLIEAKNQVTNALTPLERDELLSREGKNRIKRRVLDRLNSWLPTEGKVRELYFSRLLLT